MTELALIVVMGAAAQWAASRLRLPSILFLLAAGLLVGKDALGWVDPDSLFGDLLFPIVSLSVAVLLFEGGLGLRVKDLGEHLHVVTKLVSLGAAVTWVLTALLAYGLLGFEWRLAILLGALLTVTGPTVVQPLLRNIRPTGPSGPLLKWEGILIDPIGAGLAVLVLEGIGGATAGHTVWAIAKTVVVGGGIGVLSGWVLARLLERFVLPDHLHNPVALAMIFGGYVLADAAQHEAGLLTVTVMGVYLANQKRASVRHILEFKENVRDLLIASLFIILTARLDLKSFATLPWGTVGFLLALLLIVRPACVWIATAGSSMTRADRHFMAWMAPRGIVAAAVASIFADRLGPQAAGFAEATFAVILATVLFYGLTAGPFARRLGLSEKNPQGFLFLGAHEWARALAQVLQEHRLRVLLVDLNAENVRLARMAGLPVHRGRLPSEETDEHLDLAGIGRFFALTPNDEVNALAALHYAHDFGRREVYQLVLRGTSELERHMRGRYLFGEGCGYWTLASRVAAGATFRATKLSEQFDFAAWKTEHGEDAIPLVVIDSGVAVVGTPAQPLDPKPGQLLIGLVG